MQIHLQKSLLTVSLRFGRLVAITHKLAGEPNPGSYTLYRGGPITTIKFFIAQIPAITRLKNMNQGTLTLSIGV
jgi:hypothetical protein